MQEKKNLLFRKSKEKVSSNLEVLQKNLHYQTRKQCFMGPLCSRRSHEIIADKIYKVAFWKMNLAKIRDYVMETI